jgi:hypothetical protein
VVEHYYSDNANPCPCFLFDKIHFSPYLSVQIYNNMIEIANPIYDVVFKFLMRDEKVAKLLLPAIKK